MCSLKAILNLFTGLIQCFLFIKQFIPHALELLHRGSPTTSISFQKVEKERKKKNPVHKKAGMGAHPQEIQGK
jgi:hypothetical protein